ncbi:MAG: hypothetical protein KGJ80_10685, partial [Chloroflexota bacterium]|nr:hypothetical protein [Chloroflexota bacterium]
MTLTTRRLFTAILLIGLFTMAVRGIADADFWWHLRTGQLIVETGAVPHVDVFSFTKAGQPWVAHEWLSEVFIYTLYRLGSFPLLIITFAALIALAFAFVYVRCDGKPYVAAFTVLLAALATAPLWDVRPQMITMLVASIFLFGLDTFHRKQDWRGIWLLVPLMVLWVNLHSGYVLGLGIIAIYLFGEGVRVFAGTFASLSVNHVVSEANP